jgi:hypothetical protein
MSKAPARTRQRGELIEAENFDGARGGDGGRARRGSPVTRHTRRARSGRLGQRVCENQEICPWQNANRGGGKIDYFQYDADFSNNTFLGTGTSVNDRISTANSYDPVLRLLPLP